MSTDGHRLEALERQVRMAARGLARAGLVHAYGHCSARIDAERFLVCAAKPMGLIAAGEKGTIVEIAGSLPDHVLGEVRIHQQIYRSRPDIGGVCRTMPPNIMTLSAMRATPLPRHGFGSYFYPSPPLWDDPRLLRTDVQAEKLAEAMGEARAILMRGNGVVTAAASIEEATVLTWYVEDAARIELAVRACGAGDGATLDAEQCAARAISAGRIFERMWDFMTAGDPERVD